MKKLNLRIGMALIAGLFLFSCSNEDDMLTQVSPDAEDATLSAEDKALQDLVVQFNDLNAKYGVSAETRVVVGDDTGKLPTLSASMLRIVSSDVLGGLLAIRTSAAQEVITSVIASVRAFTKSTENIKPNLDSWLTNNYMNTYLSTIGSTVGGYDRVGNYHNIMVDNLYNQYGIALVNMSNAQLQTAVCKEWIASTGTLLPPNTDLPTYDIDFTNINDIILTNNYALSLNSLYTKKIITKNEYDLMSSFLVGLNKVPTTDLLSYCVGARQLVYYSSVTPYYKDYLCAAVSIGFASRHLWK